jgi:hypothetical protein
VYVNYDPFEGKFKIETDGSAIYSKIDITHTHPQSSSDDDSDDDSDVKDQCLNAVDIIEELNSTKTREIFGNFSRHFLKHLPFLCLHMLPPNALIKFSELEFNWQSCSKEIIRNMMLNADKEKLDILFSILETNFGINYLEIKLNDLIEFVYDIDGDCLDDKIFIIFCHRLPTLLKLGFIFENKSFVCSFLDIIFQLDDDIINIFISNGLDIEKSLQMYSVTLRNMKPNSIKKFLQFYPKPDRIAELLLKKDYLFSTYKLLVDTYDVDLTSIVKSIKK